MFFETPLFALLATLLGVVVGVLVIIFVLVPVFRGLGWAIGGVFQGIGYLIRHIFEFIFGVIGDAIRFVGGIPVFLVFGVLSILNVVIGRWSAAGHFASSATRECKIGGGCLYRIVVRRPLRLFFLDGLLEGFEQRIPEAMEAAPGRDRPTRRTGQFDGYTIVGSLAGGGSGGKLYVAEPSPEKRAAIPNIPDRVVIKSFALSDGSSLPQIVRESRALECAKKLGHVIEHAMTESRFHYVMPYIPGDHLSVVARELHARGDGSGLSGRQLDETMGYLSDLLATLAAYHQGGFWHKDVKPENIIVHNGRAHVVDLGLVTALHSAMTLTTHGTEYFRDPEMVRQALRGVKVHQVDGARFDIYAAGAVLYFMLENTFPAHGALSAFHKKSPEALRWIVRRAMAEYHQRYASANAMLADLQFVRESSDPWKIKPVDLPSMKGAEIPATPVSMPEPVYAAGSPGSPGAAGDAAASVAGFGVAAGVGPDGGFAQVGRLHLDADGNPIPGAKNRTRRPRLRVTNWWTGAYEVEDAGDASGHRPAGAAPDAVRVAAFTPQAGAYRPNRPAQEQLRSARDRVAKRRHAAQHSKAAFGTLRAVGEKQPGPMMMLFGMGMLAVVAIVAFNVVGRSDRGLVQVGGVDAGPPVLVVNGHASPDDPAVRRRIDQAKEEHRRMGYDVYEADAQTNALFAVALDDWWRNRQRGETDQALETLMARHNVFGLLHVRGKGARNTEITLVRSTTDGARERRRDTGDAAWLRVLLVNDDPRPDTTKLSDDTYRRIREVVGEPNSIVQNTSTSNLIRNLFRNKAMSGNTQAGAQLDQILAAQQARAAVWIERSNPDPLDSSFVKVHVHVRGGGAIADVRAASPPLPRAAGGRMLIVNNHPTIAHADVIAQVAKLHAFYAERGFEIVDDPEADARARAAIGLTPWWAADALKTRLAPVLDEFNLIAVVYLTAGPGEQPAHERLAAVVFEADEVGETIGESP